MRVLLVLLSVPRGIASGGRGFARRFLRRSEGKCWRETVVAAQCPVAGIADTSPFITYTLWRKVEQTRQAMYVASAVVIIEWCTGANFSWRGERLMP